MNIAQNKVGGFSAHPGQGEQLLHGARHLAMELFQQHAGGKDNVLGLGPEKAAGVDVGLHVGRLCLRQGLQGGEAGEEGGGHLIDPLIGALGGEAGGKEQLIVLLVLQGTDAIGIQVFECLDNGVNILGIFHKNYRFLFLYGLFFV